MMNIFTQLAASIDASKNGIPEVSASDVLSGVLTTVYFGVGIVAVIVIILGGIYYAISGGDASKVKFAKDAIMYAVVGLVVVLIAFVITNFVIGSF